MARLVSSAALLGLAALVGPTAAARVAADYCALKIRTDQVPIWSEEAEVAEQDEEGRHPGFQVCGDCRELFLLRLDSEGAKALGAFKSVERDIGKDVWGGEKKAQCKRFKIKPANLNHYCIDTGYYSGAYDDAFLPLLGPQSQATRFVIRRESNYRKREDWGCPASPIEHAVVVSDSKLERSCGGVLLRPNAVLAPNRCVRDIIETCADDLPSCLDIRWASEQRAKTSPWGITVREVKPYPSNPVLTLLELQEEVGKGIEKTAGWQKRYFWGRSGDGEVMFPLDRGASTIQAYDGDLVLDRHGRLVGLVVKKGIEELCVKGCKEER